MSVKLLSLVSLLIAITAQGGTIRGKVTLNEKAQNEHQWKPCASHENSVVYVTGFDEGPPPKKRIVYLDQKDKRFQPRVLTLTAGETVTFRNQDSIHHNVWSLSKPQPFDLGAFRGPEEKTFTFKTPGLIRLFCNIHPEMIGSILVLKNRRFTVPSRDGSFTLKDIPPGKHTLRVWAEGSEPLSRDVTITASSLTQEDFSVQTVPISKSHLNKFGKLYSSDY